MKRLFLLPLAAWALASCVDGDYDLSGVDTDGIVVGDDASQFDAPLARIRVSLDDIEGGGLSPGSPRRCPTASGSIWCACATRPPTASP